MELKDNSDIRNKRLNYYNRIISNNIISNQMKSIGTPIESKNPDENIKLERGKSLNDKEHSSFILNKLFGETKENENETNKNIKKLNISLSMDETSYTTPRANSKLEEFKRVVESSYVEHVLNKDKLSRQSSLNINNSDENLKTSSRNIFNLNNDNNYIFDQNQQSELSTFRLNENLSSSRSNAAIKIPYNSAYNIYDENLANINPNSSSFLPQPSNNDTTNTMLSSNDTNKNLNESNALIEKYFDSFKKDEANLNANNNSNIKKKISSTGSSLTASPTSTSSLESGKKYDADVGMPILDDYLLNSSKNIEFKGYISSTATTPREVKPPETPKTQSGGSSYRKHLLKLKTSKSLNITKISDQSEPLGTYDTSNTPIVQQIYKTAAPKLTESMIKTKVLKNSTDILDDLQQLNNIKSIKPQKEYLINSNRSSNDFTFSNLNINKKKLQPIETGHSSRSSVNLFKLNKASKTSVNVSNESDTFLNSNSKNKSASNLALQSPSSSLQSNKLEKMLFNSNNYKNSPNNLNKLQTVNTKPKSKSKKQNRNKNSIFKIIDYDEDEDEDDDENIEYNENSDDDNTFDIFSSQEDNLNQLELGSKYIKSIDKVEMVRAKYEEPLVNESRENNIKKYDLAIDLGQLSGDDEDISIKKAENIIYKPDLDDVNESLVVNQSNDIKFRINNQEPVRSLAGSVNNTARQQVKPDNIPNLVLDLIDDDKSQSVAASLAKSLCKEIDYKKEMEMIYKNENSGSNSQREQQTQSSISKKTKPPARASEIKLNKLKTNMPINHHSNVNRNASNNYFNNGNYTNTNMNLKQTEDIHKANGVSYFLKPPKSSRLATPNPDVNVNLNLARRNSETKTKQNDSFRDVRSSSINKTEAKILNKLNHNISKSISFAKKQTPDRPQSSIESDQRRSVDLFRRNSNGSVKVSSLDPPSRDSSKERKTKTKKVRKPHWKTSLSIATRPRSNSAMSGLDSLSNSIDVKNLKPVENKNDENQFEDKHTHSALFLNYSKLVSIEDNFRNELDKSDQKFYLNRPNTANANLMAASTVNLKFDLPNLNKENSDSALENKISAYEPVNTTSLNLYDSLMGDQEECVKLMLEKNKQITQVNIADEKEEESKDWVTLPHEIWLNILSYLKQSDLIQFGRTCKAFKNLYTDTSLWRKISMKYKYNMKDEWLNWIGERRPNELNIVQCSGNITLEAIASMFRDIGDELRVLNLSRCSNGSLSGDNFALQASIRCPNVTSLDLSWTLLSNQTLKLIVDSFKKIESINLSGCNMIKEDGFNTLLIKHGETLKSLEISGCIHFSTNSIINIAAYCKNIERLNISNCHRMTNESIIESCIHWLKLKFIDLKGIKNIKNNCVSTMVRRCAHLEGLVLGDCIHISDGAILEISTYKPNLKYLDISGCKKITDNSLRSIANFCTKLEYLNLKGTKVTDMGLLTLSNGKCMDTLLELNLSYLPITEFVLIKYFKNYTKLKQISLYGCYHIKHVELIKNSSGSENENLKNLAINI